MVAPSWRLSIDVSPWPISYCIAPLSTESPVFSVVVAFRVPEEIDNREPLVPDVVAYVVGEEVPMYKFPLSDERLQ